MGSVFRKWYGQVCQIRSFLPHDVPVVALTATATKLTCKTIIHHLGMREPHMIQQSPNRANIRYAVIKTSRDISIAFQWLVHELRKQRRALPCTVVFCRSITTCSKLYKFFLTELRELSYEPLNSQACIQTRLFAMFHSRVDECDKKKIVACVKGGSCRVLFSTIAFGMGIDIPCIHTIIHYGPSRDIDDYLQESGRAGRSGEASHAVLYVYPGCTLGYVSPDMKRYVANTEKCRRSLLLESFPGQHQIDTGEHTCCDVCTRSCECSTPCMYQPTLAEECSITDINESTVMEPVRQPSDEEIQELKAKLQQLQLDKIRDSAIDSTFSMFDVDSIVSHIQLIADVEDLEELCFVSEYAQEVMDVINDVCD